MGIAGDLVLIVVAALLGGLVAHMLRLPVVLGYIAAGVAVGTHTGGPTLQHADDIETMADIGIALLLFTVGLEFPVERLSSIRGIALGGTSLQMLLTTALGFGLGQLLAWDWMSSLWFGCLISVSSTMVVLKLLGDQGQMGSSLGRVSMAILIVQDLAVIPMLVLLPTMNDPEHGLARLGGALALSVVFVSATWFVGSRFLPWMMAHVASWRSRELFMITILALGLGIGYGTWLVGLSFAFGAFLAGVVLSRSEFCHRALCEVIPFRDLFSMLFFVSVGLLLDPHFVREDWDTVAFLLVAVLVGKVVILGGVTRAFGFTGLVPVAVGLALCQVGEFAFVMARVGFEDGSLNRQAYLTSLSLAALTMALTPFTARLAEPLHRWWRRDHPGPEPEGLEPPSEGLEGHLVVIGYGRVGRFLCAAMREEERPLLVVDEHLERAREARASGLHSVSGDATSEPILEAAGVSRARLVVLTVSDPLASVLIMERIREHHPTLQVLARASGVEHVEALCRAGASAAYVPELEAGVELVREALGALGLPEDRAHALRRRIRMQSPLTG